MNKEILRDESTPERKKFWEAVDMAASRAPKVERESESDACEKENQREKISKASSG